MMYYLISVIRCVLLLIQVKARKQDGIHSAQWVNAGLLTGKLQYRPLSHLLYACFTKDSYVMDCPPFN